LTFLENIEHIRGEGGISIVLTVHITDFDKFNLVMVVWFFPKTIFSIALIVSKRTFNLKVTQKLSSRFISHVLPAGHMRPSKHLNVAREHFFRLIKHRKMTLKMRFYEMDCLSPFSFKWQFKLVLIVLILARVD